MDWRLLENGPNTNVRHLDLHSAMPSTSRNSLVPDRAGLESLQLTNPMTIPSDPSAELASLAEASIELAKTPTTTSLATFWRQLAQKSIAVASRLESDLRATREKLDEWEAYANQEREFRKVEHDNFKLVESEADTLREKVDRLMDELDVEHTRTENLHTHNLVLAAQAEEMNKALALYLEVYQKDPCDPSRVPAHLPIANRSKEEMQAVESAVRAALSRTPSTALGEIMETMQEMDRQIAILFWTSDDGEALRDGKPEDADAPESFCKAWSAFRKLLTTLTGEKK